MADTPLAAPHSKPRRVLIVNYHFPPDGSVGGLRWAGFAKYLARAGWDVHVLTSAVQPDPSLHVGVKVHAVVRASTLNDLYRRIRLRQGRAPVAAAQSAVAPEAPAGLLQRIRADLSAWMAFPDYARGWLIRAGWRARRLVQQLRPDLVITSGPPHTAHMVGLLATAGTKTPTVIDMRDPWHSFVPRNQISKVSEGFLRRRLLALVERVVFLRARGIITNTRDFAEVLRGRYPQRVVKWLPNGVDPELIATGQFDRFPGLSVAYVGTLYVGRDLGPVLKALTLFFQRNPAAAADGSKLRIAGHMTDVHEARFRAQLESSGTREFVELLGVVKARAALDLLQRSSVAIVLAQDQGLQVPAKIYESVGMGIPTLVITEAESASAREANRIGAMVVDPDDIQGISRAFDQIWSGELPSRIQPLQPIDYPYLSAEMGKLLIGFIPHPISDAPDAVARTHGDTLKMRSELIR